MKRSHILRTTSLAFLGLLLLAVSLLVVPRLDDSQDPPDDYLGLSVQRMLESARKSGAPRLYPGRYASARELLEHARVEMNLQLARYWGFRDFSVAGDLMAHAQREAFSLCRTSTSLQRALKSQLDRAIVSARRSLNNADEMAEVSLQTASVRSVLASAAMDLQQAETYRRAGDYRRGIRAAKEARRKSGLVTERSNSTLARFSDPRNLGLWRRWIGEAVRSSRGPNRTAFVVVKDRHLLNVYRNGALWRSFPVDLGANFVSQKRYAGDRATPEGLYRITRKKGPKKTRYHLALLLDYPNPADRQRFDLLRGRGEIPRKAAIGGLIEIHGQGGRGYDWTDGCVAPDDKAMEIIYTVARVGNLVAIVGSDGGGPVAELLEKSERSR